MKELPDLEPIVLDYSLKNIPIASKQAFLIRAFDKTNKFIERLRWKAYWFDNGEKDDETVTSQQGRYGFETRRSAPACDKLAPFENDLFELIRTLKFSYRTNNFQNKLRRDTEKIRKTNRVIVCICRQDQQFIRNET